MNFYMDIPVTFPGNIRKTFDLIVPEGESRSIPLLIWIHGGAWCGGEKRILNDFERFIYRGYAVLSVDYRFSQEAPFPAQIIDCKTAIRWARAHAEQYGYNADRIIVGGSSAGGHLAALLGVTGGVKEYDCGDYLQYSSDVQAVVDEFGPANLAAEEMPDLKDALYQLLQDDPQKIYAASPSQRITGKEPPYLILHGTADSLVPIDQSDRFYQKLKAAGVDVQYCTIPGGEHGFDTAEFYQVLTDFILSHTR